MKKLVKYLVLIACTIGYISAYTQTTEVQKTVDNINRSIDEAVVKKDADKLKQLYADDFVFTHGTGYVEGKSSWLKDVENPSKKFTSRVHDSTLVELHDNVAIVTGSLAITRSDADKLVRYGIRYVRVFALRNKNWQLLSHRTVKEWHFK